MYLGSHELDDLLTFSVNTHDPTSNGEATDADAVPAYRVYEDETGTAILTGNMAKLDDANTVGLYSEQITLSAANGLEYGKSYTIYISAAVNSVTGTISHTFQMGAKVDVIALGNDVQSLADLKDFADAGYDPATNEVEGVKLVDVTTTNTDLVSAAAVRAELDSNSTKLAELGAANIPADIDTLLARLTSARAGYLDNLNTGGVIASQADIQGITVHSRIKISVPPQLERPDSGTTDYRIFIYSYNEVGQAEDLDSNPTITAENNAGTDRSSALGSVSKPAGTGIYQVDYTVDNADAVEGLVFKVTTTEGAVATVHVAASAVVDTTAVDFTSADRTLLTDLEARLTAARAGYIDNLNGHTPQTGDNYARLGAPAGASIAADVAANATSLSTLTARLGAWTGSGINTVLGAFKALLSSAASAPSDIGGTFDPAADSVEALRDRGDAAWTTGGGGSITDLLNITPLIPRTVDLANTATVRVGLMLTNAVDDLPSTAEITPGTISIERKAIGGTSWSAVVTDAACSEAAGLIYYDEVFDSGSGYAEGDSLRITFKSQKITVSANDYEIADGTGRLFYSEIRQTMRGTNGANTTAPPSTSAITTAIKAMAVDGTLTFEQAQKLQTAVAANKFAKSGNNVVYRTYDDDGDLVTLTIDTTAGTRTRS